MHNRSSKDLQKSFFHVHRLLVIVSLVAVFGISFGTGCSDSRDAKELAALNVADTAPMLPPNFDSSREENSKPTLVSNTVATQEQQEDTSQDTEDPATGVLDSASKLFDSARSKSGATAAGASKWVQDKVNGATDAGGQTADDTMKWANDTFESLKAQGLTTAQDTSEWLGQDYNNMESWEYKVLTLDGTDEELAQKLNAFGKEGWECFNTEMRSAGTRFYLKKRTFSYMRHLPFKDIIKLVPMMNGEPQK